MHNAKIPGWYQYPTLMLVTSLMNKIINVDILIFAWHSQKEALCESVKAPISYLSWQGQNLYGSW